MEVRYRSVSGGPNAMTTNFPGPPTWAAATAYTQNQSEVVNANYYYVCTTSGTSGNSNPFTANSAASIFNSPITDGACTWVCAQRSRQPWRASYPYTAGLPYTTAASMTNPTGTLNAVPMAQFIPIGSYVITTNFYFFGVNNYNVVNGVSPAASVVNVAAFAGGSGIYTVTFNQGSGYPWPDQIVTAASVGSPVVQCVVSGVSGSVQPTWPVTLGASVTDGSAAWATVAFN